MKYIKFKSFIDKTIALFTLIVISPILISIYFCILFKLGKPVFFLQERPGYKSRGFKIIKFRTMLNSNNDSTSNETEEKGATRIYDRVDCDVDYEDEAEEWIENVIATFN